MKINTGQAVHAVTPGGAASSSGRSTRLRYNQVPASRQIPDGQFRAPIKSLIVSQGSSSPSRQFADLVDSIQRSDSADIPHTVGQFAETRIVDQNQIAELEAQIANKFRGTAAPLIVRRDKSRT
jgi:hypothetical protein